MSTPPTASRDPPMLRGQDRVQLSEGSMFHMLELSDEECETRTSKDTLYTSRLLSNRYLRSPPMRYQVTPIVVDFIPIHGVGVDGPVDPTACWIHQVSQH